MSIMTKTGDLGQTSLFSGERAWKDDIRVEAYATVDELNSYLGVAKHKLVPANKQAVETIQQLLFCVCAELASTSSRSSKTISDEDLKWVEEQTSVMEKNIPITRFAIPGGTLPSGHLDVCRTIARRAERRIVSLSRSAAVSPTLLQFMNRLSDYLFMLARSEEVLP